jgi:hypothetical protein
VPLGSSPVSPSPCLQHNAKDLSPQIPASARSQYGSNLTPHRQHFPSGRSNHQSCSAVYSR